MVRCQHQRGQLSISSYSGLAYRMVKHPRCFEFSHMRPPPTGRRLPFSPDLFHFLLFLSPAVWLSTGVKDRKCRTKASRQPSIPRAQYYLVICYGALNVAHRSVTPIFMAADANEQAGDASRAVQGLSFKPLAEGICNRTLLHFGLPQHKWQLLTWLRLSSGCSVSASGETFSALSVSSSMLPHRR